MFASVAVTPAECGTVDAYTTEDLVFHWRTDAKAVELNKDISLPEYDLKGVSQMVCSQKINSTGESTYFFHQV